MENNKDSDLTLITTAFGKHTHYKHKWIEYEQYYESKYSAKRKEELKNSRRSALFIYNTRYIINILYSIFKSAFFSRGNPIELQALNDSGKDIISDCNKVLNHYYDEYNPSLELNKAFLSSLVFSTGIVKVYFDKNKQKVVTENIPITDIAFDSEANNINDNEYIATEYVLSTRQIKQYFENGIFNKNKYSDVVDATSSDISSSRLKVKEIYIRRNGAYNVKTFINSILVRDSTVQELPFKFGYCLIKLPKTEQEERREQVLSYGESLVEYIKPFQDEINIKRNQKNDIQEEAINPSAVISDKAGLKNPKELKRGAGKRIRVTGNPNDIWFLSPPLEHNINADLMMLQQDVSNATGVNSIQQGQTSASDRRSATALSVVNANSSMRIEDMIANIKDTLFEHWAKTWTKLVLNNADDEIINSLTGKEFPLGVKGNRVDIKYKIGINFGATLDIEKRINDLLMLMQSISSAPINPEILESILKEILELRVGSNTNLDNIFKAQESSTQPQEQLEEQESEEFLSGGL
jgi:hypothetical protein